MSGASGRTSDVIKNHYSSLVPLPKAPSFKQENLHGRLVSSSFDSVYYAYDYDVHGNVRSFYQYQPELGWKSLHYDYELFSGNVRQVRYQEGLYDQFFHKYYYDADNRLSYVYTSLDGMLWDEDLRNFYYLHGNVARAELGNEKTQAMDHIHTLYGWLKSFNTPGVNSQDEEPGRDGHTADDNINRLIGRDAYAYTLGYFDGDYMPIGAQTRLGALNAATWDDLQGSLLPYETSPSKYGLLNGNIAWMTTDIKALNDQGTEGIKSIAYQYDQLQRIKQGHSYAVQDDSVLVREPYTQSYDSRYSYDPDGNLDSLLRYGGNGVMDSLLYVYDKQDDQPNLLHQVIDRAADGNYAEDLDNQSMNNYSYDGSGNLTHDQQAAKSLYWDAYEKIKKISDDNVPDSYYEIKYGPGGYRMKKEKVLGATHVTTLYVRDAQGNIISTYRDSLTGESTDELRQTEIPVYGATRIRSYLVQRDMEADTLPPLSGWARYRSKKRYELHNHLGNIASTISDRRIGFGANHRAEYYEAEVLSAGDYYPFGFAHPYPSEQLHTLTIASKHWIYSSLNKFIGR